MIDAVVIGYYIIHQVNVIVDITSKDFIEIISKWVNAKKNG